MSSARNPSMVWSVPNLLTWFRILLIPLFVALYYLPSGWLTQHEINLVGTLVFGIAALTDWLDGYLARALNQTSEFGAFLDPVADKLMVVAALIVLVALQHLHPLIALVIIGREIAISALREWMANMGARKSVAVNFVGKIKTTAQMVAILMLLYHERVGGWFDCHAVGTWLIWLAAALTLGSMIYYLKLAIPHAAGRN